MEDEDEDDDCGYEAAHSFAGPCTCDHDEERHGWCGCTVDGCECEAHWEE